jgi:hypothetical protein
MGTDRNKVVTLRLMQGSAFRFAFRNSSYRFYVQKIEEQGVRIQVSGSASYFSPDETVFLPWNPA